MVKFKRKTLMLAEIESTYGTDPTPSASTDAFEVIDFSLTDTPEAKERGILVSSLSPLPSLKGIHPVELNFSLELHSSGVLGTAPRIGRFLQACAFSEATAASSVVYTPTSENLSSVTIHLYLDGRRHIVTGCVGTFKLTGAAGEIPMIEFTMSGIYNAPTDTANPTPTFEGVNPVPVNTAAFNYNSISTLIVQEFSLDINNTIARRDSINAATALEGFTITGRNGTAQFNPEQEALSTVDWYTDLLTSTRAVTLQIGTASTNIVEISIPEFMAKELGHEDRDGINVDTILGDMSSSNGDDELTLTFK